VVTRKTLIWAVLAAVAVLSALVGVLGATGHFGGGSPSAATFATPGAEAPRAGQRADIFPGARLNYVVSGVFHVPAEVPTGRYLVTPTGSIFGCSWKRLTKNDDAPKHVILAGTPNRGSSDEVVIGPADRYFVLLGDCTVQVEAISP